MNMRPICTFWLAASLLVMHLHYTFILQERLSGLFERSSSNHAKSYVQTILYERVRTLKVYIIDAVLEILM